MSKFSVLRPNMFLFGAIFLIFLWIPLPEASAWNPDYAYNLPKQRRMCAKRDGTDSVLFYSIPSDEDCPNPIQRYLVVFGKKPRGSMALMATTTSRKFYPPLTLKWPPDVNPSRTQLWHFTCVKWGERVLLGSKIKLYQYLGEVTSDGNFKCLEAEARALKYCQNQLKGEALLEACPIRWGG